MSDTLTSSANLPIGLNEGDVVAGRYRLERVIGKGGMGVVVSAHHLELDERVAVKFLSPHALSNPEAISRFDREVRAAARLRNEHIARVYDAGRLPDGGRYMVLEYLDGEDLSRRVKRVGPLPPELAVRYLLQACTAVLEAHGLGIVHRDIKPANLFVIRRNDGTEVVKILDFGVMKRLSGSTSSTEPQQTEPGVIVGTPLYTSPEQLRGSTSVDARTDIWSLGATLYELLAGVPPFEGKTYAQIIANVLESKPPLLTSIAPSVPAKLDAVVMRCLEKAPEDRYADVGELAFALAETITLDAEQQGLLERMARYRLASSPRASLGAITPPAPLRATQERASKGLSAAPSSSSRRLFVFGGAATISATVVVALGISWMPPRPRPRVDLPREAKVVAAPIDLPAKPHVEATKPYASNRPSTSEATHSNGNADAYAVATSSAVLKLPASPAVATAPGSPTTIGKSASPQSTLPRAPTKNSKRTIEAKPTESDTEKANAIPAVEKKNPLLVRPR